MEPIERLGVGWASGLSKGVVALLGAAGLALAVAACGGGGSGGDGPALMMDGAAQQQSAAASGCGYQHVYVTVAQVRLRQAVDNQGQWMDIALAPPRRVDLMASGGGLLDALGVAPLAPGHSSEVRLVLADAEDGREPLHAVQLANGTLAPLKVYGDLTPKGDFVVPQGRIGDVVLQGFDPCVALTTADGSGKYQLDADLSARVQLLAAGTEVQRVNTSVAGTQYQSAVARLAAGGYVVLWSHQDLAHDLWCARRFAADGSRVASQSCRGEGAFETPAVAGLADGGYAVAWTADDGDGTGIWLVQYRFDGSATGAAHRVNNVPAGEQQHAAIAALPGGAYVVAWQSGQSDIHARRYGANGTPRGAEFRVNSFVGFGTRSRPAVAGLADGGYVITWMSQFQDPARPVGIYMQRFTGTGLPAGQETLVSLEPYTGLDPAVAGLAGGNFVIAWQSQTPAGDVIVARQFSAAGTPVGEQTTVKPITLPPTTCYVPFATPCPAEAQRDPALAALADGGYVIGWDSQFRDGGPSAIYARRYAANGSALGAAAAVSTGPGFRPAVAGAGAGFVVTWDAWTDADAESDVYARRYRSNGLLGGG